jgi:D-sedoheptulose 7-phosphate isomerase
MNKDSYMNSMTEIKINYIKKLTQAFESIDDEMLKLFVNNIDEAWQNKRNIFICGNGGSAANANHICNDFIYGIKKSFGGGVKMVSLSSNESVLTCLANDVGYEYVFSEQLSVLGREKDLLIVLSGSGNSKNIIEVIKCARKLGISTLGILGYDGGVCKALLDVSVHFPINDMQISEDLQLILSHMVMRYLGEKL